jgi:hypothetical protein
MNTIRFDHQQQNVEILEAIFAHLDEASTSTSDTAGCIAASLTWSAAGRLSTLITALGALDHPDNPRRARNPEEKASRLAQIEEMIEESSNLLAYTSKRCPATLRPAPETFIESRDPHAQQASNEVIQELAELFGVEVGAVEAAAQQNAQRDKENAALNKKILSDQAHKAWIINSIKQSMDSHPSPDVDLNDRYMSRVLEKVAGKLDSYIQNSLSAALRTTRLRRQTEIAGKTRILTAVMNGIDGLIDRLEERDQNKFEIPTRRENEPHPGSLDSSSED